MNRGKKNISRNTSIIFLSTLLVFQKCFQTLWVFGFQKHVGYAWEVQEDNWELSSIKPRLSVVFLLRPSPDNSCEKTPLHCSYCGPERTHQNVFSGHFTPQALQPVCCVLRARCPCHLLPEALWQALTSMPDPPPHPFSLPSQSNFLLLFPLFTFLTFANKQLLAWFNKPHIC